MHPFILALQRGLVVQWLGRWTCNSEGCSSTAGHSAAGNKLKQVVDTRASVTKQYRLVPDKSQSTKVKRATMEGRWAPRVYCSRSVAPYLRCEHLCMQIKPWGEFLPCLWICRGSSVTLRHWTLVTDDVLCMLYVAWGRAAESTCLIW